MANVNVKSSWCPCAEATRYLWCVTKISFRRTLTIQLLLQNFDSCLKYTRLIIMMDIFFFQPPPPELGYTVTVKDLDMEKKATLTQIQKVLEEPGECSCFLVMWIVYKQNEIECGPVRTYS